MKKSQLLFIGVNSEVWIKTRYSQVCDKRIFKVCSDIDKELKQNKPCIGLTEVVEGVTIQVSLIAQ